jgi:hypothetical protein
MNEKGNDICKSGNIVEAYSKYEYSLFLVNLSVETEELH